MTARQLLEELFNCAASQSPDAVLELWHPEGILDDVTLGKTLVGKRAVTGYFRSSSRRCPS